MVYKLAVSTAGAAGLVSLDIRDDDEIESIVLSNDGTVAAEVSFASVPSFMTNDTNSSLLTLVGGVDLANANVRVPVQGGERLYLHTAAGTANCVAMIYTSGKANRAPAQRRR
jgi:hypothetical protein